MEIHVRNTILTDRPLWPNAEDALELGAILRYIRAGRCVLFVGAGMSAPSGLPTWRGLLHEVIERATPLAIDPAAVPNHVGVVDHAREVFQDEVVQRVRREIGARRFGQLWRSVRRTGESVASSVLGAIEMIRWDSDLRSELLALLDRGRYPELAGVCRRIAGDAQFRQWVQALLEPKKIPETHRDIVRIPFSAIVTTNFDDLLERAYERWGGSGVPRAPTGVELADHGTLLLDDAFFVLKAHGSAARPETMVFTAADYQRILHENEAFQAVIAAILLQNAILFVGYSLSDANFRLLLDRQLSTFRGRVPPRFAVMEDVGPAEAQILWETAKIVVLSYPKGEHDRVGAVLRKLAAGFPEPSIPHVISRGSVGRPKPLATTQLELSADGEELSVRILRAPRPPFHASGTWPRWTSIGERIRAALSVQQKPSASRMRSAGAALASCLPQAALDRLARVPRGGLIELSVSPQTRALPWEWLPIDGEPLALRNPLVRASCEVTANARGYRFLNRPLRALLIGDAGSGDGTHRHGLQGADQEVLEIAELLASHRAVEHVTRLHAQEATTERFFRELYEGDYDLVHFAGHAECEGGESYMALWDRFVIGSELTPVLARRPPALLVMSTHFTAFQPTDLQAQLLDPASLDQAPGVARSAPDPGGFTDLAMRCGVTAFVGGFGHPSDRGTASFFLEFYRKLFRARTVAHALQAARVTSIGEARAAGLIMTATGHADFSFRK